MGQEKDYTYSYNDWLEGNILPEDILPLRLNGEISFESYYLIYVNQSLAYIKMIKYELFLRVYNGFFQNFNVSLLKEEFIKYEMEEIKNSILVFKERFPESYNNALRGEDERTLLTSEQVMKVLKLDKSLVMDTDTAFEVIVRYKNLQWLQWLSEVDIKKVKDIRAFEIEAVDYFETLLEPEVKNLMKMLNDIGLKTEDETAQNKLLLKKPTAYTFPRLFINPSQSDKILKLIEEHLSSTGQWLTEPKGRHLVALYTELQSKGYLNQNLSAPMIAVSFKSQFGVQLASKNFQPQKRNDAEDYREHFQHIPYFKSDIKE